MPLGPGLPDPPTNPAAPVSIVRHRVGAPLPVSVKSVLGGLHHEYALIGADAQSNGCGPQVMTPSTDAENDSDHRIGKPQPGRRHAPSWLNPFFGIARHSVTAARKASPDRTLRVDFNWLSWCGDLFHLPAQAQPRNAPTTRSNFVGTPKGGIDRVYSVIAQADSSVRSH